MYLKYANNSLLLLNQYLFKVLFMALSENILKADPMKVVDISTKKLTDWKNEPTLQELEEDYLSAKPDHDARVSEIDTWLDNLHVTGTAKYKKLKGRSGIQPKTIRKQAEWRYSALTEPFLSTEDMFNVAPVTYEDKKGAQQNALVLNNQFNTKLQKVKFVDDYVRTAVDEGTVIVRVGWDYQEEEVEVERPEIEFILQPQSIQQHHQIHQMMQQAPEQYEALDPVMKEAHEVFMQTGQPVVGQPTGKTIKEMETKIVANHPSLEVCDYRHVMIDPTCLGDLTKAKFIIYDFESSKSELEKTDLYSNLDNITIPSTGPLSVEDSSIDEAPTFTFSDEPRKQFIVKEYWGYKDIHNTGKTVAIIASYVGDTLIRMEENPFPGQFLPFVKVQYLPKRRTISGEPDGALLEDNQKVIGAVTRGMIDIMGRSANGQVGTRRDALDITNKRKFEAGLDYEYNSGVTPNDAFFMHKYPEVPQSAQLMLSLQNAEAESLTGVTSFSSGISGQALGNTATGVRGALDAASKRELGILRRLADGMKEIGHKIIGMNAEFLSEEEVIRITNEEFVAVRRDDLQGRFDLTLGISTAEADNQKAEELAFMLQTMGNNMDANMSQMILADIAKLRKMPELAKRIEEYQPQPDPIAQKKAELEVALLEAQIATEQSKAQENQAEAQLDLAKADTERVKQGSLTSDKDKKDLDFVEQEAGITQERELEKNAAQAKGNMALKAFEKLLDDEQSNKIDFPTPTSLQQAPLTAPEAGGALTEGPILL